MSRHLYLTSAFAATLGIITVITFNPHAEFFQTIVDLLHSPTKAKEGDQF